MKVQSKIAVTIEADEQEANLLLQGLALLAQRRDDFSIEETRALSEMRNVLAANLPDF